MLCEIGLDWNSVMLDLAKGDQFDHAYLQLNPMAVVPTLIDCGQPVTESNTIMRRLYAGYGAETPILHSQQCDVWLERSLALHDAINTFTQLIINRPRLLALQAPELEIRYARIPDSARAGKMKNLVERGFAAAETATAIKCLREVIAEIDKAAANTSWLTGETFNSADMAILPFINRLEILGMGALWQTSPSTWRWLEAARRRPCFKKAIASFVSKTVSRKFADAVQASRAEIDAVLATN